MRLTKAEISGFGRLASGKVNLDNKVVAIVGPNEAGKTTLLRALAYVDNGESLPIPARSRGLEIPDGHVVVRVQYLLEKEDQKAVADLSIQDAPTSIWLSRTAAGDPDPKVEVEPRPQKDIAPLEGAIRDLQTAATDANFDALEYIAPTVEEGEEPPEVDEDRLSFRERLVEFVSALLADVDENGARETVGSRAPELREYHGEFAEYGLGGSIADAIGTLLAWVDREDPGPEVATRLYNRTPSILFFDEADRDLASTYTLSDELLADVPVALRNLVSMAELSLPDLWRAMQNGDEGERETLIEAANQTLQRKFSKAWKQSNVTVVLKTERSVLAVRIKQDGKRITQFDERSAGLKMFVALVAFLSVRDETIPPVLLIDEAETHLHIDAQADLVNTFMTQQQAAKIIYTTHSPACLPPDLGANIRAVVPDKTNESRSVIQGSFWHGAAGYSPLMLAMGAGAAAFSAARFVVLAEGAAEMLALPSLIKSAVGVADLDYQIAPGLSETPAAMYPELDLEGARVAYLVDGDGGGQEIRKKLLEANVPESRIVTLGALTLENLLDTEAYLGVIRALIEEANPGVAVPDLPDMPDPTQELWPTILETWATARGVSLPGKRVVASRLVEEGKAIPSDFGRPILADVHTQLTAALRGKKQP